jgi:RNA polymerase primary sigma factor
MKRIHPVSVGLFQGASCSLAPDLGLSCLSKAGKRGVSKRGRRFAHEPADTASDDSFLGSWSWDEDSIVPGGGDESMDSVFAEDHGSSAIATGTIGVRQRAIEDLQPLLTKQSERDLAHALRRAKRHLWSHLLQSRVGVLSVVDSLRKGSDASPADLKWFEERVETVQAAFRLTQSGTVPKTEWDAVEAAFRGVLRELGERLLEGAWSFPRLEEVLASLSSRRESLSRLRRGVCGGASDQPRAEADRSAQASLRDLEAELWIRESVLHAFFEELRTLEHGFLRVREHLVLPNLRLVLHWANRFRGSGMEFEDLVQEGNLALMLAAESFDPDRGRFSTHASTKIRSGLLRALDNQNSMIRLPVHVCEKQRKIRKVAETLGNELGRSARPEEIAEHLKWSPRNVWELIEIERSTRAIHPNARRDQAPWIERLLDSSADGPGASDAETLACESHRSTLLMALQSLEVLQREVVERAFGVNGRPVENEPEIACVLGLKVAEVRRLRAIALAGLSRRFQELRREVGAGPTWACSDQELMHGVAA